MQHRIVIVVGASSGMGLAMSARAHRAGATVVMVARGEARLRDAAASVGSERIRTVAADMTLEADRQRLLDSVDRFDHLVITAADLVYRPVAELSEDDVLGVIRSKIVAPFMLARAAAPKLAADGSITMLSGIAAERPIVGGCMTGTVNGALNAMVRGLALELAPIRVNTVSPGWVDTPFWDRLMSAERRDDAFAQMRAKIPVRRIGAPEDVAEAIELILRNRFISGSTLYVDGGQRLV